jgi:murein L,D-transpeptidase YcbB/YkuD
MKVKYVALTIVLGFVAMSLTSCAGDKKLQNQVNMQQQQIQALASEVARLDASQQPASMSSDSSSSSAGMDSVSSSGGAMYSTPSGFTLPAKDIQKALKVAGYYDGPIDGKIGSGTKRAVKNFQAANGLNDDGVCGRQTWAKLKVYLEG